MEAALLDLRDALADDGRDLRARLEQVLTLQGYNSIDILGAELKLYLKLSLIHTLICTLNSKCLLNCIPGPPRTSPSSAAVACGRTAAQAPGRRIMCINRVVHQVWRELLLMEVSF